MGKIFKLDERDEYRRICMEEIDEEKTVES